MATAKKTGNVRTEDQFPAAEVDSSELLLARIETMVSAAEEAIDAVVAAELELKARIVALHRITHEDLPQLLKEGNIEQMRMSTGTMVTITDEINCGISAERAPDAHRWLREHELGSIIKTAVTAQFGKDQLSRADALYAQLVKKLGVDAVDMIEKVHPATLKATLKGMIEDGTKFPMKLFGVHSYSYAKIAKPKPKAPPKPKAGVRR